jgi:hypothetical protein
MKSGIELLKEIQKENLKKEIEEAAQRFIEYWKGRDESVVMMNKLLKLETESDNNDV